MLILSLLEVEIQWFDCEIIVFLRFRRVGIIRVVIVINVVVVVVVVVFVVVVVVVLFIECFIFIFGILRIAVVVHMVTNHFEKDITPFYFIMEMFHLVRFVFRSVPHVLPAVLFMKIKIKQLFEIVVIVDIFHNNFVARVYKTTTTGSTAVHLCAVDATNATVVVVGGCVFKRLAAQCDAGRASYDAVG